ncbi:peroxiredoxin Q/BCP [Parapedobacter composti]|uniref:thioredoxin-dependent peroxiredoxin n=1 Tax=Parapedobacter composti TaxID=623281 RepID=A0A1I1E096_9SPHI|nr:thioredoxin-dependent thiol peroxidase [Parapedobacter composti]SFB80086.1 peroxiredoxin Q/BCP [Parapedobacter composti]
MSALKVGDQAPAFTAKNQHGETISLHDFRGKKVILYFYPKDNTPGCTAEACSFRDHYQSLQADGFEVIGVSINTERSHRNFAQKFALPFHLLVDADHHIASTYGVWGEKTLFGRKYMGTLRTTFVIDEHGKIMHVIDRVDNENAAQQVRALL